MISIQIVTLTRPVGRPVGSVRLWAAGVLVVLAGAGQAAQVTINGPAGSGGFGHTVTILPNGNIVVTDPGFDAPGPIADVGAVYLYRPNRSLVSTLRGSSANDRVGRNGIVVLGNGNYVVLSPMWDNGAIVDAGAVTFGSGVSGISGVVSQTNSLVGSRANDQLGEFGVTPLGNGNYVVLSPMWDNGGAADAGAVTFGSGMSGVSGVVLPVNSLVGSTAQDQVGIFGVTALGDGDYVVRSPNWDNGAVVNAGAVTFGSGTSGISGVVSAANSLVGGTAGDQVGSSGVVVLANGNYVVRSLNWDNGVTVNAGAVTFGPGTSGVSGVASVANSLVGGTAGDQVGSGVTALNNGNYVVASSLWDNGAIVDAGAATFGSGTGGISGVVSAANSLVGGTAGDRVGSGVTALNNGNYVAASSNWDNGAIVDAGAATFGSGTGGISGVVSPANSLVGSTAGDRVGSGGVPILANGNYLVGSPGWDNGAVIDAGAVTFASGSSGISGVVSPANSLVGSSGGDRVGGSGVASLANGNYVVASSLWDNGAFADAGAVTFGLGVSGISGVVSPINSLVGSASGDRLGNAGVTALANGSYVVPSPNWDNGAVVNAGAVTFGSGTSGTIGAVSLANSLVGTRVNDQVGDFPPIALANGNYVVRSTIWDNGAIVNAGAVTFGSGTSGTIGAVSPANSLVGTMANDQVGDFGVIALGNGNYVVLSPNWDNGAIVDAGAFTLGLFNGSVIGPITSTHSVVGTVAGQGVLQVQSIDYDGFRNQLAVGQPAGNRVVLHRTGLATAISIISDVPDPSIVGQPVTFTATVIASPNAPTDGQVTVSASSGESCVDSTPTQTSAAMTEFSCAITFTGNGVSTVFAEYTGSVIHAYGGSGPETHTTIVDPVFANGFESP
jgi:hypothetical protein